MQIFGVGAGTLAMVGAAVGGALFYRRWQQERNKPINRLRRRALQTATQLRHRMPSPEEATRPALSLTTAAVSVLVFLWQQAQGQPKRTDKLARQAGDVVSDADWYQRLSKLKERWTPHRVELEKFSIPHR